ncbi:MAG TPA: deoxyribodipyrimidine photo-lyase [Pseudonocardiaceae bacterium]|nr:deoxyribodipyrimidine photo-lyase [Pseudonocardiaceae bacterium]
MTGRREDAALLWFRRDLRLGDHPALAAAAERAERCLAVFVLDERLLAPAGPARRIFLSRSLHVLREQLAGRLLVVAGDPATVLPPLAARLGADSVHISADCAPYGRGRDDAVRAALAETGIDLVTTGSPYAVTPGRVRKRDGDPFKVFTPFFRAWCDHGWRAPAMTSESTVDWVDPVEVAESVPLPEESMPEGLSLPEAGESAATTAWQDFREAALADYDRHRDRPDLPGSSRLSAYLHWGALHPRTLLADLADDRPGAEAFRRELAWREFHADVLWHRPETARRNYDHRFDVMDHEHGPAADEAFTAWCAGATGYPVVDAGMRQLLAEGWMHNRIRMVVASFLVKDLHLPWWRGARHFMRHLVDGDLASNQLNWQWVAGCGTDAAPYFRIFNPITQGQKFDPDGNYVRRYVPELRGVPGRAVHQPWTLPAGPPTGYPLPIVEHAEERREALRRYGAVTG